MFLDMLCTCLVNFCLKLFIFHMTFHNPVYMEPDYSEKTCHDWEKRFKNNLYSNLIFQDLYDTTLLGIWYLNINETNKHNAYWHFGWKLILWLNFQFQKLYTTNSQPVFEFNFTKPSLEFFLFLYNTSLLRIIYWNIPPGILC